MPTSPSTRRCLTLEDLERFVVPNEPRISRDGRLVVFTVTRMDRKADTYYSNLWLAPADGAGEARLLTAGDHKDHGPAWSPDGSRIAFVSNRGGASNIWVIRPDGGEATRLSDVKGEIEEVTWSPDGRALAFTYRASPPPEADAAAGPATPTAEPVVVAPEGKKPKKPPRFREVRRLHYKEDGKGFLPHERQHVWVLPIDGVRATAAPRQLTDGDADDEHPIWSPDGRWIAFTSSRQPDADWYEAWSDVFRVPAGGGAIEKLTREPGPKMAAMYAPDGSRIVYCGHLQHQDGGGMTNLNVWTIPAGGGEGTNLSASYDRTAINSLIGDMKGGWNSRIDWSPDGARLFVLVSDRGATRIVAMPSGGGRPEVLTSDRADTYDFSVAAAGGRLAFVQSDPATPGDVWTLDPGAAAPRRLTRLNTWLEEEIELSPVEELQVTGKAGPIHTWRVRPPAAAGIPAGAKLPAVLHIHGGPHGMYGWTFVHEFQMLAARGFVVAYSNPRGGQGYGQGWADAIKGRWGTVDYDDLMAVADEMGTWPFVDAERIGVGGGSYGGYMTNWIVTQTQRFKAAVTMRSICNLYSDFGTSDFGYFTEWYWGALPWTNPEKLMAHSPIKFVSQVRTPLLILHAEEDHRCPIEQAEQFYTALKFMKREVAFVRYPEESHGLTRGGTPSRRLDHQRRTRDWFEKHLGPMPAAAAAAPAAAELVATPATAGARRD